MDGDARTTALFIAFGLGSQGVLLTFFAARRWRPHLASRLGPIAYAVVVLGLPLAAWLWAEGTSVRTWGGPLLLGAWGVFGSAVDLWRRIEWRSPIRWGVFVPYLTLYFFGQMFMWWPLWDEHRIAWGAFAALFVGNTTLNLRGHFGGDTVR